MDHIEKRLAKMEGGDILDVATGAGEFVFTLSSALKSYHQIIGIDNSNRAISTGKKKFEDNAKVIFQCMDAHQIKFEDAKFDTVAISNSLHHFAGIGSVLAEMQRVLKSGGNFLINEMCCDEDQSEAQKNHILLHHWCAKVDSCFGTYHRSTYTKNEITELINMLHLADLQIYEYSFPVEDARDENLLGRYLKALDAYLDPLRDKPEYRKMKEEAENLKLRLQEYGFAPARSIFCFGRKQSTDEDQIWKIVN